MKIYGVFGHQSLILIKQIRVEISEVTVYIIHSSKYFNTRKVSIYVVYRDHTYFDHCTTLDYSKPTIIRTVGIFFEMWKAFFVN